MVTVFSKQTSAFATARVIVTSRSMATLVLGIVLVLVQAHFGSSDVDVVDSLPPLRDVTYSSNRRNLRDVFPVVSREDDAASDSQSVANDDEIDKDNYEAPKVTSSHLNGSRQESRKRHSNADGTSIIQSSENDGADNAPEIYGGRRHDDINNTEYGNDSSYQQFWRHGARISKVIVYSSSTAQNSSAGSGGTRQSGDGGGDQETMSAPHNMSAQYASRMRYEQLAMIIYLL